MSNDVVTRIKAKNETDRGLREADRSVSGFARRTANIIKGLAAGFIAFAGARGIGRIAKGMFEAGSAAIETRSKFETVFGPAGTAQMDAFNTEFGKLAGISQVNLQNVTSTTAAIVQGMGLSQEASVGFSQEITKLAGDLASFHNLQGGTAEAARVLQGALSGEAEPLKRLGIVLRAADVDQRALTDSGKRSVTQLTEQERVMARFALITERAGVAVGDLDRTQDSAANRARRVQASFENLKNQMSTALIPVFESLLGIAEKLATKLESIIPKFQEWVNIATDYLGITEATERIESSRIAILTSDEVQRAIAFSEARRDALLDENRALQDQIDSQSWFFSHVVPTGIENARKWGEQIDSNNEDISEQVTLLELYTNRLKELQRIATAAPPGGETTVTQALTAAEELRLSLLELRRPIPEPRLAGAPLGLKEIGEPARPELGAAPPATAGIGAFQTAFVESLDPLNEFVDSTQTLDDTLGRMAGETLINLGAAFNDAFAAIGAGEPVFGAITKAIKASIAETAAAEGRLEFARGAAKIAAGIFPPNPAAIASGLQHFAAGALFSAIGGALGGGQGPRGAGGGAGGGFTGRNELRPTVDPFEASRSPSTIIIQGGILDMSDPAQADALAKALSDLSGRDVSVAGVD